MSKKVKWFKSAFSQENTEDEIPSKIPRRSQSFCNLIPTISLIEDDDDNNNALIASTSKSQANSCSINVSISTMPIPQSSKNWLEYFTPTNIDDLAIHPKKISEIQDWFKYYEKNKTKNPGMMLLLTGPTGSGKTTVIKVISKHMNYNLIEWINPVDIESFGECNLVSCTESDKCPHRESQISIFRRFLFRSSRYKSLLDNNDKRLVLIEDFPNVFLRDSSEFHNILSDYRIYGKSPLIFIVTDSKSRNLNIVHNLFPDQIISQYNINNISLNSISTTIMKKALKIIATKIRKLELSHNKNNFKIPSDDILDSVNLTAQGDIRNAILNLYLVSVKGVPEIQKELLKKNSNNTKQNKGKKFKSIGCDENLTTMHALGRVMYPKYDTTNSKKSFIHSPEEIANKFSSESNNFVNLIHANYLTHFNCIEDVLNAADYLSLTDIIMNEYRADYFNELGLILAIRGVMASNKSTSNNWAPIKGMYKQRYQRNPEIEKYRMNEHITKNMFVRDYETFVKIIKNLK